VNAPNLRDYIVARLEVPGPVAFDRTDAVVQPETAAVGVEALPASVLVTEHASGEAQGQQRVSTTASGRKVLAGEVAAAASAEGWLTVTGSKRPHARLRVPTSNPKPVSFYRQVADTYRRLAAHGNRPAVEMANANGVPVTTVHRWVKEARRRGFLPPGQKGRRG
jgi:hypothetical protein